MQLKVISEVCRAARAADLMVHPNYRGLGIYKQIRKKLFGTAREKHLQLAVSFPNELATSISQRLGSGRIFKKTPLWIKPLNLKNIVTRYLNNDSLASLIAAIGKGLVRITNRSIDYEIRTQVREVKEIDERFDYLWKQASSLHEIMLVRDRAYLNWRYVKKPDADYTIYISENDNQLLGYVVLRNLEDNGLRIGWIADMLTSSKDSPASMDLIAEAVKYFKMEKVDAILCVLPQKAYLTYHLQKHGFTLYSRWSRSRYTINYDLFEITYPESTLVNPNNWYLTRGDSDLI